MSKTFFTKICSAGLIVMLALAAMPVTPARAAACIWTGNTSTAWATNGNWSSCSGVGGLGPPAAADTVTIGDVTNDPIINGSNVTVAGMTIQNGGLLTVNDSNNRTITVNGGITIDAGGSLVTADATTPNNHTLNISGDITNDGILDFVNGNDFINTTFNGATNQTVSGAGGTTDFNTIVINNSGGITSIIDITSTNFTAPNGFLTLTSGTFRLSTGVTIDPVGANLDLTSARGFIVNNASALVDFGNNRLTVSAGSFQLINGTFNIDNNDLIVSGGTFQMSAGTLTVGDGNDDLTVSSGSATFSGGTVYVNGRFQMSGGTINLTGANLNLDPKDGSNLGAGSHVFEAQGAAALAFSSGTVTIIDAHNGSGAGNAVQIVSGAGVKNFTGSTIRFGNGASTTTGSADGFDMNCGSDITLGNVIVNNTDTNIATRFVRLVTHNCNIGGDFAITDGEFRMNSLDLSVAGNFTNNDIFTPGTTGTVTMNGTAAQNLGGSNATTFYNFTINNANGVTLGNNITVNNTLTFTNGRINTGANTVILPATATATGNNSSYVNGNVRRVFTNVATNFTFPIGDATNFAPI